MKRLTAAVLLPLALGAAACSGTPAAPSLTASCGGSLAAGAPANVVQCTLWSDAAVRVKSIQLEIQGADGSDRLIDEPVNRTVPGQAQNPGGITVSWTVHGLPADWHVYWNGVYTQGS